MTSLTIGGITLVVLLLMILSGIHIGVSLAIMGITGCFLISGSFDVVLSLISTCAFSFVREYNFAVIPLFILMGVFMSLSGAASDLFKSCNYILRRVMGGLGIATVVANAIFAAVTGVSVASASVFSKVAMPEMEKFKYKKSFAVGTICGSSVLGMLIPPSVLMILYGMLAEVSIGRMFMAGIIPGLVLTIIYSSSIILRAKRNPALIGREKNADGVYEKIDWSKEPKEDLKEMLLKPLPTILLIVVVLGGIWGGFFTASEAAGIGAFGAMLVALGKGMRLHGFKEVILETASSTASIMFLLVSASLYAKMLALAGLINWLSSTVIAMSMPNYLLISVFLLLIILMGCILDSSSILLITTPLMAPVMSAIGFDLIWWGIVVIVCVEMGLLTPPFGMCVFAVKAALGESVRVEEIFMGSMPYFLMMILLVLLMLAFPSMVTWLPSLM